MQPAPTIEVAKWILQVLNNVCDIERKLALGGDSLNARRNTERIKEAFDSLQIFYEDPMGQAFDETRTDLEASITGAGTEDLEVVEVIKPIVRVHFGDRSHSRVVQKGIVVVQSKTAPQQDADDGQQPVPQGEQ